MRLKYGLFCLIGMFCLSQTTLATATNTLSIPPFEALYKGSASVSDIPISGKLRMALSYEENDQYRMRSDMSPNGAVALLISRREHVIGKLQGGVLHPLNYEEEISGVKNSRTQLTFNWQDGILEARHDDEQATLPLSPGVVDPLSLYLMVMTDLLQNHIRDQYVFVDDTELKTYRVKRDGEETLQTPLGKLPTIRITQQREGSSRVTTFWFAPSLKYLPIQIIQEKKGNEVLRMMIQEVKGISP